MDISIFVPVYKESNQLSGMLDKLSSQNVEKEIFVTVDEPTPDFTQTIKSLESRKNVKFIINQKRVGKANALNETVKLSSGKVLLFLDSDVQVTDDADFLRKIIMETKFADILDIKKQVKKGKSFLSKMAYYEYFAFNISAWLSSTYMHKCPCVNGAAFAIKREAFEKVGGFHTVVAEDIDLSTRAFLQDGSCAYGNDVEVKNVVFDDWGKWLKQRRRWAIGQALWTMDWYQALLKKFVKKPQVFLPSLFFLYPSIAIFFLSAAVPKQLDVQFPVACVAVLIGETQHHASGFSSFPFHRKPAKNRSYLNIRFCTDISNVLWVFKKNRVQRNEIA